MLLDERDKPISAAGNVPLQVTSQVEAGPAVNVNLDTKANFVHVTLLRTNDTQSPKDVTIEIVVCVEPSKTTPKVPLTQSTTRTTPASNQSVTTPGKTDSLICRWFHTFLFHFSSFESLQTQAQAGCSSR